MNQAGKKAHRGHGREFVNSFLELVTMVKAAAHAPLSAYNTIEYSNNTSLITLNQVVIAYLFAGNGIFQAAIQSPVQDALSKGITIKSDELDDGDIDKLLEYIDRRGLWEPIMNYEYWRLCFGGAGLVINTGQDPSTPFRRLRRGEDFELYDVDRWQLSQSMTERNGLGFYEQDPDEQQTFILNGVTIDRSRLFIGKGKRAPWQIRQQLSGWGMSEAERMIRDLNNYLKTQNVLYEILDEAKLDIYHVDNLAAKLLNGQTGHIVTRIQAANQLKNYLNALVLDSKEQYEQKTNTTFTGLAEVMSENRIGIAAALRRPMTKLFGLSPAGFSNGDADLETYFQLVESEARAPLKPAIRKVIDLCCQSLFGFTPEYKLEFPPLKQLSETDQEDGKTKKSDRVIALYSAGLLQAAEAIQILKKEGVIDIDTAIERGVLPPPPNAPEDPETPPEGPDPGTPENGPKTGAEGVLRENTRKLPEKRNGGPFSRVLEDFRNRHGDEKQPSGGRRVFRLFRAGEKANAGTFREDDHPRGEDGKFGTGGGGKESASDLPEITGVQPLEVNAQNYGTLAKQEFDNLYARIKKGLNCPAVDGRKVVGALPKHLTETKGRRRDETDIIRRVGLMPYIIPIIEKGALTETRKGKGTQGEAYEISGKTPSGNVSVILVEDKKTNLLYLSVFDDGENMTNSLDQSTVRDMAACFGKTFEPWVQGVESLNRALSIPEVYILSTGK